MLKMSKNTIKEQEAKGLSSSVNFSKVKLLQMIGLLDRKFNSETLELESSPTLRLWCYLSMILKSLFSLKFFISYFFPNNDRNQLFIGSIFNDVPRHAKYYLGLAGIVLACWSVQWHFAFNYLNSKDYRLFKFWMKLTHELPVKGERDYRVAGLSKEENKNFWTTENYINHVWYRVMNCYLAILTLAFISWRLLVPLEGVEVFSASYILFQTIHIIHDWHAFFSYGHACFTTNLLYAECMWFFSRRFESLGKRVERLSAWNTFDRQKTQKLARLVLEYNRVHYDLIQINEFFKFYVGVNLCSCFACTINAAFVLLLDIPWGFKVIISTALPVFYLVIICLPFGVAKSVKNQIKKTKRRFENLAFHRSVNTKIRQKIELISNLSEKAGFTCFDWFLLDTYTSFKILLEFAVNLLLLIQASYYYSMF